MTLGRLRGYLPVQFPSLARVETQLASTVIWLPSQDGAPIVRRGPFIDKTAQTTVQVAMQTAWGSGAPANRANNGARSDTTVNSDSALDSNDLVDNAALQNNASVQGNGTRTRQDNLQDLQDNVEVHADANAQRPEEASTTSGTTSGAAEIQLTPWQVTGVKLPGQAALELLSQFTEEALRGGPAGVHAAKRTTTLHYLRPGPDLIYWSHAAKFALELLIGQHYVPGVYADAAGQFSALWQPALNEPYILERFDQLVMHMPPICRAYHLDAPAQALSARTLLEDFMTSMVDMSVRGWSHLARSSAPATATPADVNGLLDAGKLAGQQWLRRLRTAERRLDLPPQPAHQLYQDVTNWLEQLHATGDANFRIGFVLETPEETQLTDLEHLRWKLAYYLQARDNPSLLIPARQVWQNKGNVLKINSRRIDHPQERLLAGLGAVSHLFAPIERSLRKMQPEAAYLSTDEAHQFLREVGPLLATSGYGVIFPEWWRTRGRTQLGLHLHLRSPFEPEDDNGLDLLPGARRSGQRLGFGAPIQYSWELSIGGQTLSRQEFERLAGLHAPLVRIGNRWVELDAGQVDAARRFLERRAQSGSMSFLQALRLAQGWQVDADAADGLLLPDVLTAARHDETTLQPAADENGAGARAASLDADLPLDLRGAAGLLAVDGVDVGGYLQRVFDRLKLHAPEMMLAEPAGFVGELRPYQRRGLAWLTYLRTLGLGGCLADDMGLGKTIQAIALHLHTRNVIAALDPNEAAADPSETEHGDADVVTAHRPTLLICPTSVMANWRHEIERFAPTLRVLVHHGNGRLAGAEFVQAITQHDFIITSYGTARRDIDLLLQHHWDDVILDEAQNIKNPNAKQSQAVRRIQAHNRVALTGTPVENHLSELWSIMHFLNPGYLGGFEHFRKRYIVPIERYNDDARAAQLRRLVQPILLRRLKTDPAIISDLPEKNEMVVYCSLTDEQRQLYTRVVQESLSAIDQSMGLQRRGLVLGLITKLKQICNHPAHFLKTGVDGMDLVKMRRRSGKLSRLHEMLEEALTAGDQALIFTQFVEMGTLLQSYLNAALGVDVLFLHGGTPAKNRERMVQHFQSEDGPPIFILSLRAGGFGLNLTRANRVFHYDRWWNPAIENQATDRAFRIGQQRNVQVHKFVTAGTLEVRIHEMIESKIQLAEQIMGSGEEWLTEMNTDELRALLQVGE